jgi:hypothetical protein
MPSYILVRCRTGLNECLSVLSKITEYAIKYNRKIILEFMLYKSTDLRTIFDFSDYPVEVITDTQPILNELVKNNIDTIPSIYKSQILDSKDVKYFIDPPNYRLYDKKIHFDLEIEHPSDILLVIERGGIMEKNFNNIFKYLKLKDTFYQNFKDNIYINSDYNSIHIRHTDGGENKRKINIRKINKYIIDSTLPVFIASDNNNILTKLKNKYDDKIILSNTIHYNKDNKNINKHHNGNLHQFGIKYSNVLVEAIQDLLLLASAKDLLITNESSGYSRLARFLYNNKEVLNNLINIKE